MSANSRKTEVASLRQQLGDANVHLELDVPSGAYMRTRRELAEITFHTASPCQSVAVLMTAGGALLDIDIDDDSLDRFDHQQMARRITETIQEADKIATDAVELLTRNQLRTGRH